MSEYQKIQSEPATHPMDFQSGVGRIVRERDALLKDLAHARKQTAELVEAVERYNRCPLDAHDRPESWDAIADIQAAAAQFKEK